MNKVESDVPNFEATAAAFAGKDHFVIFKADWCPDCQAVSAVEEALQEGRNPDLNLVVVDVGEKGAYKSPDFVFRTNWVGLKGVPSLYYFSASGEMSKCEAGLSDGKALKEGGAEGVKVIISEFLKTV